MPLLIPEGEWREIARGVEQRAELFERILATSMARARWCARALLPAAAVTGSTDFLASLRGVAPPGGRWLRLYAADIGRGPDGRWWVLGDRTQAPFRLRLRAGEPPRRLAGVSEPLHRDERASGSPRSFANFAPGCAIARSAPGRASAF